MSFKTAVNVEDVISVAKTFHKTLYSATKNARKLLRQTASALNKIQNFPSEKKDCCCSEPQYPPYPIPPPNSYIH